MAYDEALAARVRTAFDAQFVEERRMFGGLAFLVGGSMAVAVAGQGSLMVRVDPSDVASLLQRPGVGPMMMGTRGPMNGWVLVEPDALADDHDLAAWVRRGTATAAALDDGAGDR